MKDHYETFAVDRSATPEDITSAYRTMSFEAHPDNNPPDNKEQCIARFKVIANAYEVLHLPEEKEKYGHKYDFLIVQASSIHHQPKSASGQTPQQRSGQTSLNFFTRAMSPSENDVSSYPDNFGPKASFNQAHESLATLF